MAAISKPHSAYQKKIGEPAAALLPRRRLPVLHSLFDPADQTDCGGGGEEGDPVHSKELKRCRGGKGLARGRRTGSRARHRGGEPWAEGKREPKVY